MTTSEILYVEETFFQPKHSYSPSDFYSLFSSFCDYLTKDTIRVMDSPVIAEMGDTKPNEQMEEAMCEYIRTHIREYEPELLERHIELVETMQTPEQDFRLALYQTTALYRAAATDWANHHPDEKSTKNPQSARNRSERELE